MPYLTSPTTTGLLTFAQQFPTRQGAADFAARSPYRTRVVPAPAGRFAVQVVRLADNQDVPILHYATGYLPPDVAEAVVSQRRARKDA